MKTCLPCIVVAVLSTLGCFSSSSSEGPELDALDVGTTPSGAPSPGVILTLSAHSDGSHIVELDAFFADEDQHNQIPFPDSPKTIRGEELQVAAPSGKHELFLVLSDAKGRSSGPFSVSVTVP
jgi:hypothetical protein